MVNVSVIVTTLNEAENLPRCLAALQDFDEVIVVDSNSTDGTKNVAESLATQVVDYQWDGHYPKKRQWCLDNLNLNNDYVFFVDADELVTAEIVDEMRNLSFKAAGYFIRSRYIWHDQALRHGVKNNKLCLLNRHKMMFPVIDDLGIEGMGEIEGHYQPVLRPEFSGERLRQLNSTIMHYAYDDGVRWQERHERYAMWEAKMIAGNLYPADPSVKRETLKRVFRRLPFRGGLMFLYCYVFKLGFLDGMSGFRFAVSRFKYYRLVSDALATNKRRGKTAAGDRASLVSSK